MALVRNTYDAPPQLVVDAERVTTRLVEWVVFGSTFVAVLGEQTFLGYKLTGWGWFVPFCVCSTLLLSRAHRASFPSKLWVPWVFLVTTYLILSGVIAAHRSIQM